MNIAQLLKTEPDLADSAGKLLRDPDHPFPILSLKVKLTWQCNLRCHFCRLWQKPGMLGTHPNLNEETVKQALATLKDQGLLKVHFSGGEVLLVKNFASLVKFARSLDLQVNMTTNGTLLTKDTARFLVEERVHSVTVSIDAANSSRHDAMRGVKGAWKMAWQGIENLIDRKQKKGRGPVIAVNTLITRQNVSQISALYQRLVDAGVERWRLLPVDSLDKKLRPTADQWHELSTQWDDWKHILTRLPVDWTSAKSADKAEKGLYAGRFYHEHPCFAPWFNMFIDADGLVYPCCMGKGEIRPYGNLMDTPVESFLTCKRKREICCSMAAKHTFEVCQRCDDFLDENRALWNTGKLTMQKSGKRADP